MSTALYKRTEVIGRGKFGVVYKGYNKQTKLVVAIKVLNLDSQEEEVADVQQEIQFLTELKNVPNVTHYYGSFLNDTKLWIIMDYCAGGSIRTLLKSGVFEEKYIGVIVRELLVALQSVHKLGVIHRDLKAANVLISKEGNVQLCDFGVAAQITSQALKRTTMAGTPYWMAPEVIREGDMYNVKADIWSLGITVYEITTGNPPYADKDAMWAMQMISKLTPPRLEGREYSAVLKEAIALCLDENPDERPMAEDLLKCRLVKQYRNHPTMILKELVTKYLLWRDQAPSNRDSVTFMNLDEEAKRNAAASAAQNSDTTSAGATGGPTVAGASYGAQDAASKHGHTHHPSVGGEEDFEDESKIQIKWDFDSLSSREYIIENDIDLDRVDENYNTTSYLDDDNTETYNDDGTLNFNQRPNFVGTLTGTANGHSTQLGTGTIIPSSGMTSSASMHPPITPLSLKLANNEIPKSLLSLFEDEENDSGGVKSSLLPQPIGIDSDRVDSPTIEIPDMDNLANFTVPKSSTTTSSIATTTSTTISANTTMTNSTSVGINRPALNKPPTLYHSQSASGNLESRPTNNVTSRPRKKTISNTLGSNGNSMNSNGYSTNSSISTISTTTNNNSNNAASTVDTPVRGTPPYGTGNRLLKTPSPKPVPNSTLVSQLANSSSPSKSMKALNYNTNPLLQPINFKTQAETTIASALASDASTPSGTSTNTTPDIASTSTTTTNTTTSTNITGVAVAQRRARPGLHIQMPTPSSTVSLSALTNNEYDNHQHDSNLNQFGFNPQATIPMTMTPVTETADTTYEFGNESSESDINPSMNRERSDSTRYHSLAGELPQRN